MSFRFGYIVSQSIAFVPHPHLRGLWLKTHACVLLTACAFCEAKVGEPCRGKKGIGSWTHASRRIAVGARKGQQIAILPSMVRF